MRLALLLFLSALYFSCDAQPQPDRKLGVLIEAGPLLVSGEPDYVPNARRLRVIVLKHFNGFSLGTGFGLDGYYANNTAPLFLDFRYYEIDKFVPFLNVGNAMRLGPEFDSGLIINAGAMTNIIPNKKWLKASLGYNYQRVSDRFLDKKVGKSAVSIGLIFSLFN
ncbi:MAG: hypothetical protein RIF46_15125 [Cyclobacteriaceae bacterium]